MQIDSNTLAVIEKLREDGITIVRRLEHRIELVKTYRGMVTLKVNGETVPLHEGETLQLKTGDPVVEF